MTNLRWFGMLSLAVYVAFLVFSWISPQAVTESLRTSQGLGALPVLPQQVADLSFILTICALVVLYLAALRSHSPKGGATLTFPLLSCFVLLFSSPVLSTDITLYTAFGRMMNFFGLNPYTHTLRELGYDPIIGLQQAWLDIHASYGPVWLLAMGAITGLSNHAWVMILLVRVLAIISYLFGIVLVGVLARGLGHDASRARFIFAWNPLVLLETASNGHSEMVILTLILLAFVVHKRFGESVALPILTISALIKPVAAFLAPLYLIYCLRTEPRSKAALRCGLGCVLSLTIAAAAYLPFWSGFNIVFAFMSETGRVRPSSLPDLLHAGLLHFLPQPSTAEIVFLVLTLAPLVGAYALVLFRPPKSAAGWLAAGSLILLVLVSLHPQQWYFLWPMVIAAPLANSSILRLAVMFTMSAILFYPIGSWNAEKSLIIPLISVALFLPPTLWLVRQLVLGARQGGYEGLVVGICSESETLKRQASRRNKKQNAGEGHSDGLVHQAGAHQLEN